MSTDATRRALRRLEEQERAEVQARLTTGKSLRAEADAAAELAALEWADLYNLLIGRGLTPKPLYSGPVDKKKFYQMEPLWVYTVIDRVWPVRHWSDHERRAGYFVLRSDGSIVETTTVNPGPRTILPNGTGYVVSSPAVIPPAKFVVSDNQMGPVNTESDRFVSLGKTPEESARLFREVIKMNTPGEPHYVGS